MVKEIQPLHGRRTGLEGLGKSLEQLGRSNCIGVDDHYGLRRSVAEEESVHRPPQGVTLAPRLWLVPDHDLVRACRGR